MDKTSQSAWAAIERAYLVDEKAAVRSLLAEFDLDAGQQQAINTQAMALLAQVQQWRTEHGGLEAFLHEYNLSSQEGVLLMCLAEALIRIPDADTAERLIRDKLGTADWQTHLGQSDSLLVNAGTWGLMLTGRLANLDAELKSDSPGPLKRLIRRSGEPLVRLALKEAMRIMAQQFVMGRTIDEALSRSQREFPDYRYSFDMLGEAALGAADTEHYFQRYQAAIAHLADSGPWPLLIEAPGISVKLSALHPRFEPAQRERVLRELLPRVTALAHAAMQAGIGFTLDAEESERLGLTLEVFAALLKNPALHGWAGLGLAVQAYQKRASAVIDWLIAVAKKNKRRFMLRLVKGAYWDAEIKHAQQQGLVAYPVYTRKAHTDVAYLACARRLLAAGELIYPQFATHNAHTVAVIQQMAAGRLFEFQRLHGMGGGLYDEPIAGEKIPCRIYAPVGGHRELLPYLMRRLLENGSNTSFVNRLSGREAEAMVDPLILARTSAGAAHPHIPLPTQLFGEQRQNSLGLNVHDVSLMDELCARLVNVDDTHAGPLLAGESNTGEVQPRFNPADSQQQIGSLVPATAAQAGQAMQAAHAACEDWQQQSADARATILERTADLLETERETLLASIVREGGRCVLDALDEIREAVDFLRYYAQRARKDFSAARLLPGPAGERNEHGLHARGVFVCISPWNFPLAIFSGQIAAALAAGNAVVAKPSGLSPLTAWQMTRLFHRAGVPAEVLQLLPGASAELGEALLGDPALSGVAFTGATQTARVINQRLAQRAGGIVPLIAETGGQNVMIADSSALPEQLVTDVLRSAFNSAGQRCSALRVLFVQDEIAPRVLDLLREALAERVVGDPADWATDIGPLIDAEAQQKVEAHMQRLTNSASLLAELKFDAGLPPGYFVAPSVFEIDSLSQLSGEVFGPLLHVIRYQASALDSVIDAINASGYGLTLGVHSRIESTVAKIRRRVRVGNLYVNRDMVGAVVGVQPFGGEGLSGTGPKAGGRFYLPRFATERVFTSNTAAVGGDVNLLSLDDE